MPGRAATGQGIRVMFRQGYRGAASRLLLGLPVCVRQDPIGLYVCTAALLEEREQGGGRRQPSRAWLKGTVGLRPAVGEEDAPSWSLLSSGLSREEGGVKDCQGWFSFWVE